MLTRWLLRLALILLCLMALFAVLFWQATSHHPVPAQPFNNQDLHTARQLYKQVLSELRNSSGRIVLTFDQRQLDALMNVAGYTLPHSHFSSQLTAQQLVITATAAIKPSERTVQVQCVLQRTDQRFAIDKCQLGSVPIPGLLSNFLLKKVVSAIVAAPADQQLLQLFAKGQLLPGQIHFTDNHAKPILINSRSVLTTPATLLQTEQVLAPDLLFYLTELNKLQRTNVTERRLAFYTFKLLQLARQRADSADISQLHSATWALIVAFGNKKFAHFAAPDVQPQQLPTYRAVQLAGRQDLALHFLYSAALELLSSAPVSAQIGYLKERLDAGKGGSGFSFVDLAADKAGIAFATQLESLLQADISHYNAQTFEQALMPPIHDLPEGLTEHQLQLQFGGYQGAAFQQLEQRITERVSALPLYTVEVKAP